MTPFEKAGYTKDTKFKVLRDLFRLKKGDIVTLKEVKGRSLLWFKTEDGRNRRMYLPNMAPEGYPEELEVYEEPKKELTPFEKAGYTKDTKFRVSRPLFGLNKGDIVTLFLDDGTRYPLFKTEEGSKLSLYLPNMAPAWSFEQLEVYEGGK